MDFDFILQLEDWYGVKLGRRMRKVLRMKYTVNKFVHCKDWRNKLLETMRIS